jgi:hypothetical protein
MPTARKYDSSVVSVTTDLRPDFDFRLWQRLYPIAFRQDLRPTCFPNKLILAAVILGVNIPELEGDHSPPSNVKNLCL